MRASAALRSPAWILSASADCAWAATAAASSRRRLANDLDHIGRQLVVMGPEALLQVVEEPAGIVQGAGQSVQNSRVEHVVGAVALAHAVHRAVVNGLHHV